MPSKAQIEQAIRTHFESWNSKDKARWLANFAEDVRLEDPVGGVPKIGRDGLEKSWSNSFKGRSVAASDWEMVISDIGDYPIDWSKVTDIVLYMEAMGTPLP